MHVNIEVPPSCVSQDILHELPVSHIRCVYLKKHTKFTTQHCYRLKDCCLYTYFWHPEWFLSWLYVPLISLNISHICNTQYPSSYPMIYSVVLSQCTSMTISVLSHSTITSGVKVSSTSCFSAHKPITLYNHCITISAGSSLWALYPFSVMINPLDVTSIRMLVPLVFAKISSTNCLFLTFVAFIWKRYKINYSTSLQVKGLYTCFRHFKVLLFFQYSSHYPHLSQLNVH